MSKVVRQSKFRHVFGTVAKKEDCIEGLKVTRNTWDSNLAAANPKFFAVLWEAAGGGSFCVGTWTGHKGKWAGTNPLVSGHKAAVLDIDWNPFNDNLIASASEDCLVKIWNIPDGGLKEAMTESVQTLGGHKRKVGIVKFNPTSNNVLCSAGGDFTVKVWDVEKGESKINVEGCATDLIQSVDWNYDGSCVVMASKDKKVRTMDPRTQKIAAEVEAHQGVKGLRAIWLGNREKIFSAGFSKTSEREYCVWDPKKMSEPLNRATIDSASGLTMPFYDNDTGVLFLAGKGDGNIRYYEIVDEAPYIHYLTEFKSANPTRGIAMLPKRGVNVSECEIVRLLKVSTTAAEPVAFQVPRKADVFQDDLYPDCYAGEPSQTAADFFANKNTKPKLVSLKNGFVAKPAAEFNPVAQKVEEAMSEADMKKKIEELTKRVAYLESEVVKKDAKIKELESK
jgi:hypothetical protein